MPLIIEDGKEKYLSAYSLAWAALACGEDERNIRIRAKSGPNFIHRQDDDSGCMRALRELRPKSLMATVLAYDHQHPRS